MAQTIYSLKESKMHIKTVFTIISAVFLLLTTSCQKEIITPAGSGANLVLKFKFDPTQARLGSNGQPAGVAVGNAGQDPNFNSMSAHYAELAPTATTLLGAGAVIYKAPETTAGGASAIDFSQAKLAGNNEIFLTIPLSSIAAGSYEWLRLSLAYQNFDAKIYIDTTVSGVVIKDEFPVTMAGFIGFNSYIKTLKIKDNTLAVNSNKLQGFWAAETKVTAAGTTFTSIESGQAPAGATTVPNPIFATSPVPAGSCVVTGAFAGGKLSITGQETSDVVVEVSISTNKSFEWKEVIVDGKWQPSKGEALVDMGIRGMIPRRL